MCCKFKGSLYLHFGRKAIIDGFQIDENNTDLRTPRFECEALSAKQTAAIVAIYGVPHSCTCEFVEKPVFIQH